MKEHETLRSAQLGWLLFLCLAVDMAVRPFTGEGMPSAQRAILAAVGNAAAVCLLLAPVQRRAHSGLLGQLQGKSAGARIFLALAALLFACAGGAAAVRTENFFRYVSDEALPRLLFYAICLLAVFYALRSGPESLMRVACLASGIFLVSMLLMLVSNLGTMHLPRLGAQPFDLLAVLETAARGFRLPPELLLVVLLAAQDVQGKTAPLRRTLAALAVFYICLTFCAEAVLGSAIRQQTQTIHTLSRLGSISVFRRMDALHITAWMLAELCKLSALCYGIQCMLTPLLPSVQRAYASLYAIALLAAAVCVCVKLPQKTLNAAASAGTAVLLVYLLAYSRMKEGRYAKKKSA